MVEEPKVTPMVEEPKRMSFETMTKSTPKKLVKHGNKFSFDDDFMSSRPMYSFSHHF